MVRIFIVLLVLCTAGLVTAAPPPVTSVAYSADGSFLAVGTRGTVYVLNDKGDLLHELSGQTQRVTALAYSQDFLAVASGEPGKSGLVKLYRTQDFTKPPINLDAHRDIVYTLRFSPDGTALATAGYDRVIKIWNVAKPAEPAKELKDHSDTIYSVAFRTGGKQLASVAADRSVKVWDVATGKRLYSLGDATDWLYALSISADGTKLVAGGVDRSLRTWDLEGESAKLNKAAFAHSASVLFSSFSPDGKLLYSMGEDKIIKVWDAKTLTENVTFKALPSSPLAATLRPDGQRLAVGFFDGSVQVLDTKTGNVLQAPLPLKPKPPVLTSVDRAAIRSASTATFKIAGKNLTSIKGFKTSRPDLQVKYEPKSNTDGDCTIELTAPASARPGYFSLTGLSEAGDTNTLQLVVDAFATQPEPTKSESAKQSELIPIPVTLVGKIDRTGDVDYVRLIAKKGDEIGVQLVTPPGVSNFDPVLTLTDGNGVVLQESTSKLLGFVVPADGTYAVGVADAEYRGSPASAYRLNIGPLPIITSVFPLAVTRGTTASVQLQGVNLGDTKARSVAMTVPADALPGSKLTVPGTGHLLGSATVMVSPYPTSATNDITVPGAVNGWIRTAQSPESVTFSAKKGQRLMVEVEASRLGSLLDSTMEIVDAQGKVVPRATLRSVSQTFLTFRDHDSVTPGIRLESWNELRIGDLLYCGAELMKIKAMPKNPDDDCQFVQVQGKREAFFGTTTTHHAQNSPMYKVELHPPGATFPPNGLPVIRLDYRNDDGGDGFGKDSMLDFTAPTDGTYTVRLRDTRGHFGERYGYRVVVRHPQPSYSLSLSTMNPAVWKNGGVPLTVTAKRIDGYSGPINIEFENVPAPLIIPKTVIEAEQTTAVVTVFLNGDSIQKPGAINVKATAVIGSQTVVKETSLGTPTVKAVGDLTTTTSASEFVVNPGKESKFIVKIERQGDFKDRVPLEVRGLPHGVKVQNIGLNGILILPTETEREVVIYAEDWVQPMELPIVVSSRSERRGTEHAAKSVLLKISK